MEDKFNRALQVFMRHFLPAKNAEEADEKMTTPEILEKFQDLFSEESIDSDVLTDLLTQKGYTYDYILDGFYWLLKTAK